MTFAGGKCRYGRQGKKFIFRGYYTPGSPKNKENSIQKAEERLTYSQSEKEDCSTQALNS